MDASSGSSIFNGLPPQGALFSHDKWRNFQVDLPMPMGINYVHNFQFQYPTVDNASQVAYVQQGARFTASRQPRGRLTRGRLYPAVQRMLTKSGLDRACLLRAICESSSAPIVNSGLIGELLQTIFTPFDPEDDSKYNAAWKAGHQNDDCFRFHSQCSKLSILDSFSHYL